MKIKLIAIGTKMPAWVTTAYQEYARRLPHECSLELIELAMPQRGKNADIARLMEKESEAILAQLKNEHVVALDERGKPWTTVQLAGQLENWQQDGRDVALLVGGPDGLAATCLERAGQRWSLSPLTLPHPMVRVLLAETLYRAWTVTQGHPYHRK